MHCWCRPAALLSLEREAKAEQCGHHMVHSVVSQAARNSGGIVMRHHSRGASGPVSPPVNERSAVLTLCICVGAWGQSVLSTILVAGHAVSKPVRKPSADRQCYVADSTHVITHDNPACHAYCMLRHLELHMPDCLEERETQHRHTCSP